MKKYIVALVALTAAASVLAQGQLNFSTRVSGVVVGHVYAPEAPGSAVSKFGNTASETPLGTQTYAGGFLTGSGWSAQLWGALGAGQDETSLAAMPGSLVTFRTGSTLGGTPVPTTVTTPFAGGSTGTFQVRAWDNVGGTVTTWAAAEALWKAGTIAAGVSELFNVAGLSVSPTIPPTMDGFRSFNVYFVPEPTTFALLGLGALGMLIFRRK